MPPGRRGVKSADGPSVVQDDRFCGLGPLSARSSGVGAPRRAVLDFSGVNLCAASQIPASKELYTVVAIEREDEQAGAPTGELAFRATGVKKHYPGVKALDGVDQPLAKRLCCLLPEGGTSV